MPNFRLINELRTAYPEKANNRLSNNDINVIQRTFSSNNEGYIFENFSRENVPTDIIRYLEQEREAHVVNIFIDITSFSTKASSMSNNQLSKYLDGYYDIVIPIIQKYGGEVEKIIGDGIIAIFGQPFLTDNIRELTKKADNCSKEIITVLAKSMYEAKIALHDGVIQYYKNKKIDGEYTMIGQPLTDLFRLESISDTNSINYYCDTEYDKNNTQSTIYQKIKEWLTSWYRADKKYIDLKGVSYKYMRKYTKG
jgi:class 3 adenylate cyclase